MAPVRGALAFRELDETVPTAAQRPPAASTPPRAGRDGSEPGTPVTFAGTTGFFHPGTGDLAVLMLSAWGYEEFCLRTTWRSLAGRLAAAGVATLRFDWPGTGDALDPPEEPAGLDDWRQAAREAAALLRRASGARRLVLVGQGLGGALASAWAGDFGAVDGCVLMAPVSDGRRYLRELSIWSRIITDRIGIGPDPDDATGTAVAGFGLPQGRIAAVRGLAAPAAAPAREVLLVERPGHAGDAALAARMGSLGATVARTPYSGFETLTMDPTAAVPPADTIAAVADWIGTRAAASARAPAATPHPRAARALPLRAPGFVEQPLRFGPGGRLFGVLCEPASARAETLLVFANAGRDYHVGWGRMTVDHARAFARRGMASLRFDAGGIGDSPPGDGTPAEVLYSAAQIDDLRAAIDFGEASGYRRVAVIGRCSGAYAALQAAVADARIARVVLVNIGRFHLDPEENLAEAMRYGHRSLGDFGATLRSRAGLKRLLTGRLRIRAAGLHLASRFIKAASLRTAPVVGRLTRQGRFFAAVHGWFANLAARGAEVTLVFADGDPGLAEFRRFFGREGQRVARHRGLRFRLVAGADHNFTHRGAQSRLLDAIAAALDP